MRRDFDEIMPLACAFELIHTATLVHDDIYDGAEQKRSSDHTQESGHKRSHSR